MGIADSLPPPLVEDFLHKRWLLIVGAGYSRNATLESGTMPDWHQLAGELAKDLRDYEPQSDIDGISAYEEQYGRPKLAERLTELLHARDARPGRAHEALCRLDVPIVMTTNFDFLLERGYDAVHRPCQPVVVEEQLSQAPRGGQTQLLKLHGDLNHPQELVATEDDF
jgi:SIR2-like domain